MMSGVLTCMRRNFLFPLHGRALSQSSPDPPPGKLYQHPTKVSFYYDTLCPYSWLAYEILLRYRPIWALELTLHPVSLRQIHEGNGGPSLLSKLRNSFHYSEYYFSDIQRKGKMIKVPIQIPESPFYLFGAAGSDNQQQFLLALSQKYPELLEEGSRQFWYRTWGEDMDANKLQSLLIMARRIGLTQEEAVDLLESLDSHKETLAAKSMEAIQEGAFDLPFIRINPQKKDSECFVGADCFELLAHRLQKTWKGPIPDPEDFESIQEAPSPDLFVSLEVFDKIQEEVQKVNETALNSK
uniref:Glutathione S-transferase kappa 1 n=1 Tax=Caligus clemensi TaxID=344056 RepID=C1C375_CALCM|nr:Glutathione S-transferase kappa 1 [Caligus clemensi]